VFAYVKGIEREVYRLMNMINAIMDSINKNVGNSKELAKQIETLNKMLIEYNKKTSDDSKSKKYIR
jgi:cell shape-determining protein MreC